MSSGQLAAEYGFTDLDGSRPDCGDTPRRSSVAIATSTRTTTVSAIVALCHGVDPLPSATTSNPSQSSWISIAWTRCNQGGTSSVIDATLCPLA